MGYLKQSSTSERLQKESFAAFDKLRNAHGRQLYDLWLSARRELRAIIWEAYRTASGGSGNRWTLSRLKASGAYDLLRMHSNGALARFHALTTTQMRVALTELKKQSVLRHAWVLDTVTPGHHTVRLPMNFRIREAEGFSYGAQDWETRWTEWVNGYQEALLRNVRMGALNGSDMLNAADEVDATKASTPASTLWDSLQRIYTTEAVGRIAEGEDDVFLANEEDMEEEIWRTRGDLDVCEICQDNEGSTPDEADSDIPAHPYCHCYWQMVPKAFADLLRSGSLDDRELAKRMDLQGVVPNAMVIRGPNGEAAGKVIVSFERWVDNEAKVATGGLSQ